MATLLTKTVVCDEGLDKCDNTTLQTVRLTIDGKTATQILCAKHRAPHERLLAKMKPDGKRARGKVYTPEEIARLRAKK